MAFYGKVALVTGAASGMGRMSALRLAEQGAKVAAIDMNEEGLKSLENSHANIRSFQCDISNGQQVEEVVTTIRDEIGEIDRLTHAAAIMPLALLNDMPVETIIKQMRINYEGTVYLIKNVMPQMLERNKGDIICFGSIAGDVPLPLAGAYCATKAATNAFVKQLILENEHTNLRILLMCPPPVNTPLLDPKNTGSTVIDMKKAHKQGLVVEPEFILEHIEKGLESGKAVVYPGNAAKITVKMNQLLPKIYWKFTNKISGL